jgi:type VI secretion system protein ImpH
MEAAVRATDTSLERKLFEEPFRYDFFQAVRLLEKINGGEPVGFGDTAPKDESVRFRTRPTLEFPASEIYELNRQDIPEMFVAFMGLMGAGGQLPLHYTELVAERARHKDFALWEFLDIFNHRFISLFYRAWEKYRFAVSYERNRNDEFTSYLYDLMGLGTRGLRGELELQDQALVYYAGLISQKPHSATAISALLSDYFGVNVVIEQFRGQWLSLDDESKSYLGQQSSTLGITTVAGEAIWDVQSGFGLCLGPLDIDQYKRFLPDGPLYPQLKSLVQFLTGIEFDFIVNLTLKASHVPDCTLGTQKLGWTTWLKTSEFIEDDSQLVLSQ